jgi:outer membrane protein TolC
MHRKIACGGLALAALLCGCVGAGLSARERALEERVGAEPAPARSDEDPFAGQATLERGALVREALRRNPGVQAARSASLAALARVPQESALADPMLDLALGPRSFGSDAVDDAFRVGVAQAFPFPGKRRLRGEIALAEAEASAQEIAAERVRVAAAASLLFDEYYLAARARERTARHLELVERLSGVALARYESGNGSQQDALLAEAEQAELLHGAILLETDQRRAAERINTLLHRLPELPLPPPPASLAVPGEITLDTAALTEQALARSPALRASRSRVAAQEQAVALAKREFLPDFTVSGGYDRFWQEEQLQPMVGLALNVPLQVSRRRGALAQAQAELARAKAESQRSEAAVRLAVASGVGRLREAHHLVELARDRMLPVAGDRVVASRAAFESGTGSFLELVDSERRLRSAELEYEEAVVALWRRHAELDRATADLESLCAGERP